MTPLPYSLVIATCGRCDDLQRVFACLETQTLLPRLVVVIDASDDQRTRDLCERPFSFPLQWVQAEARSAARQRNQGADLVGDVPLIGFCDDDLSFPEDHFEKLIAPFSTPPGDPGDRVSGTTGRLDGVEHRPPGRLLKWYYRLQAGYPDLHYGARLFGPGINTHPCYALSGDQNPIRTEWLNSGCVMYRTAEFLAERFPLFNGYSYFEDVHLSARMAKRGSLWFLPDAVYHHHGQDGPARNNGLEMARMYIRNQRRVGRDVMGLGPVALFTKQLMHRVFVSIAILRQRPPQRMARLWGTWSA